MEAAATRPPQHPVPMPMPMPMPPHMAHMVPGMPMPPHMAHMVPGMPPMMMPPRIFSSFPYFSPNIITLTTKDMQHYMPMPPGMLPPGMGPAVPGIEEEPNAKRIRTEENLIPEEQFLTNNPVCFIFIYFILSFSYLILFYIVLFGLMINCYVQGPVNVVVQVPNEADNKFKWNFNGQTLNFTFNPKDPIQALKVHIYFILKFIQLYYYGLITNTLLG